MEAGKLWAMSRQHFAKVVNRTSLSWKAFTSDVRLGHIFGTAPFDERFTIGLDRDSDLWLRAHSATIGGRKDAANTSPAFFITNSDFQKPVIRTAWLRVGAGPFLD